MTLQTVQEQVERDTQTHQRILEVLANRDFMYGVYEAAQNREDRTPWKDLKRKDA